MRKLVLSLILAVLLLAGCSTPIGRILAVIGDFSDHHTNIAAVSGIWTGDELATLQNRVALLGLDRLSQALVKLDPTAEVVVSFVFDGCNRSDPGLVLDGSTLLIRFGTVEDHDCAREVPTLAVFAIPRPELPDPATLRLKRAD